MFPSNPKPAKPLRIFLVRHGESLSNLNKKVHLETPDHAIGLSENGKVQAQAAGTFLRDFFNAESTPNDRSYFRARIWVSPYLRTRQTADHIEGELKSLKHFYTTNVDRCEHINLVEQQFGLFDGLDEDDLFYKYPTEHAHYKKCEDFEGKFWARMPLGESRFDVAVRVHQAFGTFHRDYEKHGIRNLIIVSHGVTNRAFAMQWLHQPFEWFEKEKNPANCSIRLIENNVDKGYIYKGG